jgi:hypothetical protein
MNNTKKLSVTQSWRTEYYSLLKAKGVDKLLDFLKKYPAISYNDIALLIGKPNDDDNYIEIKILLSEEAKKYKQELFAIQDILVRYLHKANVKWSRKIKQVELRYGVYSTWKEFVYTCYQRTPRPELNKRIKQIWDYLEEQTAGNIDWLPADIEDPLIVKAFEKIWF